MEYDVERLYRQYGPMVIRHCTKMLGDPTQAADAAQDVFVKVLSSQGSTRYDFSASLLYTIATNVCLNRIRAQKNYDKHINPDDGMSLIEKIASLENVEDQVFFNRMLNKFLNKTSASSQLIAMLYFVEGLTLEQVAEEVGMSVSGIRKRLKGVKSQLGEEYL